MEAGERIDANHGVEILGGGLAADTALAFNFPGGIECEVLGVSFGETGEPDMRREIFRRHQYMDSNDFNLEIERRDHARGIKLLRSVERAANHLRLVVDLSLARPVELAEIKVDDLRIKGEWREIAIVGVPNSACGLEPIVWRPLAAEGESVYHSDFPFLALLLRNAEGGVLEVGSGDDLWRWHRGVAESTEAPSAEFAVEASSGLARVSRRIMPNAGEPTALPRRDFRFGWYLAYSAAEAAAAPERDGESLVLDAETLDWDDTTRAERDGVPAKAFCMRSPSFEKRFKKLLRSKLADDSVKSVALRNFHPSFCDSASHLRRARKKQLAHWDATKMMELWFWCQRQAAKHGKTLTFEIPADRPGSVMPSISGLALDW